MHNACLRAIFADVYYMCGGLGIVCLHPFCNFFIYLVVLFGFALLDLLIGIRNDRFRHESNSWRFIFL